MNLQTEFDTIVIFTILILPTQEHGISLYLFMSSLISFISVLQFSVHSSFVSLGRFFPKYFILFCCNGRGLQWFFSFAFGSWGTCLLSFFTFAVCFKCQTTVEWLMLSSLPTSHVAVRGLGSMMALSCQCNFLCAATVLLSFKALNSCKTSRTVHHCTVCSLAVPGLDARLMLQDVLPLYNPFLNSNKKIARICFLSNFISIV